MSLIGRAILLAASLAILVGCSEPQPSTAAKNGPPPPPPAPRKPQRDPYEVALEEVRSILQRYGQVYAGVRDEATANKALGEIGRMKSRLVELAEAIRTIPYQPTHDEQTLLLHKDLSAMQTAQLTNENMQRVLADPDLQVEFLAAHSTFLSEGMLAVGQAVARHSAQPAPQPEPPQSPTAK
jgi:hypothetical protein